MAQSLTDLYKEATEEAQAANEARYQQAMGISDEIAGMYSQTGSFGQGYKASLERAKSQSVSSGLASLVQSGLGATGGAASLATAWEQGVGAEARLKLEDLITEKRATALQNKIGLIQSKEDIYPDYSQLYQASAASASAPSTSSGVGGFDMDQSFGGGYTYGSLGGGTSGGTSGGATAQVAQPAVSNDEAWWKWWNEMQALESQQSTTAANTAAFTGASQNVPTEEEDWWNEFYGW